MMLAKVGHKGEIIMVVDPIVLGIIGFLLICVAILNIKVRNLEKRMDKK